MKTSEAGIALIKQFEGMKTKAYQCSANKWTLGYGHTKGIKEGMTCTPEQAEEWLGQDLRDAENAVQRHIKRKLTQNQFDALVSFTFNVGAGNLKESTLRRMVNSKKDAEAAAEFERWVYADGKKEKGLIRRRKAEAKMYAVLPWLEVKTPYQAAQLPAA